MIRVPEEILVKAIRAFDYPPVTYDFVQDCERPFGSMRALESHLQNLLHATDERSVKDGLSGVLYWGYYRVGYRDYRVKRFRERVTDRGLRQAIQVFQDLEGIGLRSLKKLALPEFSNMAFITKLRVFLEPERYCVLDSKIASLGPLAARLMRQKTSIPINDENERAYAWWVDVCGSLSRRLQMRPKPRPVDVERGLFHLVDDGRREEAEWLLASEPRPDSAHSSVACGADDGILCGDDAPRSHWSHLGELPPACEDGIIGNLMQKEYVRKAEGAYRIADTRVSLESLVYLFHEGMSAESMVESYPSLTLEQVYGALAFYLANQKEIDAYLTEGQRAAELQHQQSRHTNAELIAKLHRARNASQIPG